MNGFPVLMYHALSIEPVKEAYVLTQDQFRLQMSGLARLGKYGTSVEDLLARGTADPHAVVVSFDDGHVTNKTMALPILEEFGFKATFFVTTGKIGTDADWLSWDDLVGLKRSGMDIQAHGHTHRFLDNLAENEQWEEMHRPLELLTQHLGAGRRHFSFPGGRYTDAAIEVARKLEYSALCTSEPGLNNPSSANAARLFKRFLVDQRTTAQVFEKFVLRDSVYARWMFGKYMVKKLAKQILGNSVYHTIWRATHNSER